MELLNLDVIRSYGFVLLQGLGNTVLLTLIVIVLAGVLATRAFTGRMRAYQFQNWRNALGSRERILSASHFS